MLTRLAHAAPHPTVARPPHTPPPAPACSPSGVGVGAGFKPASSARDAPTPTPRHVRAPSLPRAVLPPPHSPNLRRQPAKNPAQAISRQPESPLGIRAGER